MISVLYVDDEAPLLEIGKIFLESPGEFTVDTAESARDVLASGSLLRYDAIVSDYQMPVMDGIAFLKEVRARYDNIPFILFTGKGREEVVIQAINEGADFYLQKGGDPQAQYAELRHKIRQAVHRRQAELALRDSEKRLTDIINFLPDATFAIGRDGRVIAWNRAIEKMTAVPAADMLGKGNYEYALPFYPARRKILIDLVFEPDEVIARNYSHITHEKDILIADTTLPRPQGRTVTLMGTASPLYNSQGEVVGAIESIRDVTDRKQAEDALRRSEERYRTIFGTTGTATVLIEEDGTISLANSEFERLSGYSREEIENTRKWMDFVVRDDLDRMLALHALRRKDSGAALKHYEFRFRSRSGDIRDIYLTVDLIPGTTKSVASLLDITERKRAEEELRRSEERYRNVVEDQTEFISRFLPDGTHVFVNDAYCRYFGLDRAAIIGHRFQPIIHPEDARQVRAFFASLTAENPVGSIEHRIIMPDGSVRWQRWSDRAIFNGSGKLVEYQSVGRDTTAWKEAEIQLKESEKRFSEIIEFAPNATFVIDREGHIIVWNRAIEQMTGMKASAMLGRGDHAYAVPFYGRARPTLIDLVFGEDPETVPLYQNLRREGSTIVAETFCNALNGNTGAWAFVKASPLRDASGRVVGAIESIRDISDIRNAEIALENKNEELNAALARVTSQGGELRKRYDELAVSRSLLAVSEERYRTLAEASRDFIFVVGIDGTIEYVNSYAAAILGLPASQVVGKKRTSLFPPELADRQAKGLQRIFETGKAARSEGAMEIGGTMRWFDHYLMPITGPGGKVTSVLGVSRDISDRKRVETSLRESEERYHALFDAMHDCVAVYRAVDGGKDFEVVEFNAAAERTERIPRDRVIGRRVTGVFPGAEEFGILAVFRRVLDSGVPEDFPVSLYHDDRITGWRENYVYRLPSGEIVANYRDETEKKQAEEALKASGEKFRAIFNNINDAVHIHEVDGRGIPVRFLDANDVSCRDLQYSRDELLTLRTQDFAPEYDALPLEDLRREILASGHAVFETVHLRRDGTRFPVEVHACLTNLMGKPVVISVIRDITRRKEAEYALRESGEQYRSIFDSVSDGLIIFDREGQIAEANPAACAMHGRSRDEMIGLSGTEIIHPRSRSRFAEFLRIGPGEAFSGELAGIRRDGTAFRMVLRGRTIDFHGSPHLLAVITDLAGDGGGVEGPAKRGVPGLITTDSMPL